MALGPASHVKPVTKQMFGRASPGAAREAAGEALPNGALLEAGQARAAMIREGSEHTKYYQIWVSD